MINLGVARLVVSVDDDRSVVTDQFSQTPLQLHRPLYLEEELHPTVYIKSPSSGLLGNDKHVIDVTVEGGSTLELRTQASTLVYPGLSILDIKLRVAASGRLTYLPHPIILGAGSSLVQKVRIDLAAGAAIEYSDTWCAGRIARNECWQFEKYDYLLEIFEENILAYREHWQLKPASMPLTHPLMCGEYTHFASVYNFGQRADKNDSTVSGITAQSYEVGRSWSISRGRNTILRRAFKVPHT